MFNIGITKKEYRELLNRDFNKKDTLPLSPIPILEETVGAFLCMIGEYSCFPWKGKIYSFVEGELKLVKDKDELLLSNKKNSKQKNREKVELKKEDIYDDEYGDLDQLLEKLREEKILDVMPEVIVDSSLNFEDLI